MKKLLFLLVSVSAFAYPNCTSCHNGGYKEKLDKYTPAQIEAMMKNYQKQPYGMMGRIAASMNDEEIKEAAQKYGKQ